ncbi:MAG TPA: cadherin-like domain-containing protein, partial [Ilumatobacter sp.]
GIEVVAVGTPSNGMAAENASGGVTYTPAPDFCGSDSFTYTIEDDSGSQATATVSITVTCVNDAPDCSAATPSVAQLWPPDHRIVPITVNGVTDVDSTTITITITSVEQDEPTNKLGDGDTDLDGSGIGTETARVRAERSGKGDGRVYEIGFTASDGAGGTCSGSVLVGVPHDDDGQPAVDSVVRFPSTVPTP